jgi:hypothetical protein
MEKMFQTVKEGFKDYGAIFCSIQYMEERNRIISERERAKRFAKRKEELHRLRDDYQSKFSAALRNMKDWERTCFRQAPEFSDHHEWWFDHDFLKSGTEVSQYGFKSFLERWRETNGGESQQEEHYMRPEHWRVLFLPLPNKVVQVDLQYRDAAQLTTWGTFSTFFQ